MTQIFWKYDHFPKGNYRVVDLPDEIRALESRRRPKPVAARQEARGRLFFFRGPMSPPAFVKPADRGIETLLSSLKNYLLILDCFLGSVDILP